MHGARCVETTMAKQSGFWSVNDRLVEALTGGDPLGMLNATVNFRRFRPILERVAAHLIGYRGCGRFGLEPVTVNQQRLRSGQLGAAPPQGSN